MTLTPDPSSEGRGVKELRNYVPPLLFGEGARG